MGMMWLWAGLLVVTTTMTKTTATAPSTVNKPPQIVMPLPKEKRIEFGPVERFELVSHFCPFTSWLSCRE